MKPILDEELLDFLTETLNIGVGNAAAALEQLLNCPVKVSVPAVKLVSAAEAPLALGEPGREVVGVKMRLVGDVPGTVFFVLPAPAQEALHTQMKKALPGLALKHYTADLAPYAEIANILTGVYLSAINDFCKLALYHSVPAVTRDMFQAVVDETLALLGRDARRALLVVNEFAIEGIAARTFLLMFFSVASEERLAQALTQAAGSLVMPDPPKK